ncbi:unnamed protein product [Urochloa humidicola]
MEVDAPFPPPPPPPHHHPPSSWSAPAEPPKLLRRSPVEAPGGGPAARAPWRADLRDDFLESPPLPPRTGRPPLDDVEFVPVTPSPSPLRVNAPSYAKVVRRPSSAFMATHHQSPHGCPGFTPPESPRRGDVERRQPDNSQSERPPKATMPAGRRRLHQSSPEPG